MKNHFSLFFFMFGADKRQVKTPEDVAVKNAGKSALRIR